MSFFTAGYLELNRLHKAFSTRGQSTAASAQQDDSSPKPAEIPSQHRVSLQLIQEWQPFKDLRQRFANTPPNGAVTIACSSEDHINRCRLCSACRNGGS